MELAWLCGCFGSLCVSMQIVCGVYAPEARDGAAAVDTHPLLISASVCTHDPRRPTAFGATFDVDAMAVSSWLCSDRDAAFDTQRSVSVQRWLDPGRADATSWTVTVSPDGLLIVLSDPATATTRRYVALASGIAPSASRSDSGLTVRMCTAAAAPEPQFGPFGIAVNITECAMAVFPSPDGDPSQSALLGVGVVHCGDVPSCPNLLYQLRGPSRMTPDGASVATLRKTYEEHTETAGVEVALELRSPTAFPFATAQPLTGEWRNPGSGAHGAAAFWPQRFAPDGRAEPSLLHCDLCGCWIAPLTAHVRDPTSGVARACLTCIVSDKEPTCEDDLRPAYDAVTHAAEASRPQAQLLDFDVEASGSNTATIAAAALQRFASRTLFTLYPCATDAAAGPPTNITYADAAADVARLGASLAQRAGADAPRLCVLIAGHSTDAATVVAALAAVCRGDVAVPLPPAVTADRASLDDVLEQVRLLGHPIVALAAPSVEPAASALLRDAVGQTCFVSFTLADDTPLGDAEATGALPPPRFEPTPDAVVALLFTSGTTSRSRCVEFTDALAMPTEGTAHLDPFIALDFARYDPTHLLSVLQTMRCGGARLVAPSPEAFFSVAAAGQPTHIGAPPTTWAAVVKACPTRMAAQKALGKRLQVATCGGAAAAPSLLAAARSIGVDLVELYGSREAGGIARNGVVFSQVVARVRPNSDAPQLAPTGTGELLVWSPRMVSGYVRRDDTKFVVDAASGRRFYATGDVVDLAQRADGRQVLRVVGRTAHAVKTTDGTWSSTAPVEAALETHAAVHQAAVVLLRGSASSPCIACVAVLKADAWPVADAVVFAHALRAHAAGCAEARAWLPTCFHFTCEPFTAADGLLTDSGKKRSAAIEARFRDCAWLDVAAVDGPKPVATLHDVLRSELGELLADADDVTLGLPVAQLSGLDSIGLLRFTSAMRSALHAPHLSPAAVGGASLLQLDAALRTGSATSLAVDRSHMSASEEVQWLKRLEPPAAALAAVRAAPLTTADTPTGGHAVLLVGAGGFIGPVLLQRFAADAGWTRVWLLVRSAARLQRDCQRAGCTEALDDPRVRILTSDRFDAPNLGLADDVASEVVASRLAAIVHNAAHVSDVATFDTLRGPNVDAPVQAALLAHRADAKLVLVSSIAALPAGAHGLNDHFAPLTPQQLQGKDAYGQSKAVVEAQLAALASAAVRGGLRGVVFVRPSLVGPDDSPAHDATKHTPNDAVALLLRLCDACGAVPDVPGTLSLNCVRVGRVADVVSVAALGQQDTPVAAEIVAATGPTIGDVLRHLAQRKSLERVPLQAWRTRARAAVASRPAGWSDAEVAVALARATDAGFEGTTPATGCDTDACAAERVAQYV